MLRVKKFAVYRSATGKYCYQYADTLEALEGTGFENIITEEQLPVVFDGRGGYFRFRENDPHFLQVVETDKESPLELEDMFAKNSPDFKLGWISPEGDTYSCAFTNHAKCAKMIAQKFYPDMKFPETALDKKGWLQVIDSWNGKERQHGQFVFTDRGIITRKQADKLFDLGLYYNEEVQKILGEDD